MDVEPDRRAARIALLVASASAVPGGLPLAYQLDPGGEIIDQFEACVRLAALDKPIFCSAEILDDVVVFSHRTLDGEFDQLRYERQITDMRMGTGLFGTLLRQLQQNELNRALLQSPFDAMLCSAQELVSWREQYVNEGRLSITAVWCEPSNEPHGAVAEVRFVRRELPPVTWTR